MLKYIQVKIRCLLVLIRRRSCSCPFPSRIETFMGGTGLEERHVSMCEAKKDKGDNILYHWLEATQVP